MQALTHTPRRMRGRVQQSTLTQQIPSDPTPVRDASAGGESGKGDEHVFAVRQACSRRVQRLR